MSWTQALKKFKFNLYKFFDIQQNTSDNVLIDDSKVKVILQNNNNIKNENIVENTTDKYNRLIKERENNFIIPKENILDLEDFNTPMIY